MSDDKPELDQESDNSSRCGKIFVTWIIGAGVVLGEIYAILHYYIETKYTGVGVAVALAIANLFAVSILDSIINKVQGKPALKCGYPVIFAALVSISVFFGAFYASEFHLIYTRTDAAHIAMDIDPFKPLLPQWQKQLNQTDQRDWVYSEKVFIGGVNFTQNSYPSVDPNLAIRDKPGFFYFTRCVTPIVNKANDKDNDPSTRSRFDQGPSRKEPLYFVVRYSCCAESFTDCVGWGPGGNRQFLTPESYREETVDENFMDLVSKKYPDDRDKHRFLYSAWADLVPDPIKEFREQKHLYRDLVIGGVVTFWPVFAVTVMYLIKSCGKKKNDPNAPVNPNDPHTPNNPDTP